MRFDLDKPICRSTTERVLTSGLRGLVLWEADPTLTVALETAKTFAARVEYLMLYWPSECASSRCSECSN